jgi:hypothetical protein
MSEEPNPAINNKAIAMQGTTTIIDRITSHNSDTTSRSRLISTKIMAGTNRTT